MKYHVATDKGQWIGGFMCRRDNLEEVVKGLQPIADLWESDLVATRLDGKRRGDTIRIAFVREEEQ